MWTWSDHACWTVLVSITLIEGKDIVFPSVRKEKKEGRKEDRKGREVKFALRGDVASKDITAKFLWISVCGCNTERHSASFPIYTAIRPVYLMFIAFVT